MSVGDVKALVAEQPVGTHLIFMTGPVWTKTRDDFWLSDDRGYGQSLLRGNSIARSLSSSTGGVDDDWSFM